ncbi:hypothetical protein GOZ90_19680 [Agrobacterium vitis]|uniref:Uncharacterized protein n=1 Tax=Agrobacterium vitis TaxID=373 RepID=A0A6L6VGI8_AGRVI|nr:hypothetical protein [Agrobacterium vitis]MUZ74913.1 hypothetical protein [Agrobacterium vitis]MVA19934.1 hypothetical protein [Agrobacterium vitis]
MNSNIRLKTEKTLNTQREDVRDWLLEPFNKNHLLSKPIEKKIQPFLNDEKTQKKLIPGSFRSISVWYRRQAEDKSLNQTLYPAEELALSGIYTFWYYECAHAVMESDDPAGYRFSMRDFTTVSTMLSLGWMNHAGRLAETMFDRWDEQEDGNGSISWESLPQYLPWLSVKLYKAWRDSDEVFDFEPKDEQLEGFHPLLQTIFNPSASAFGEALIKAADFHVMGIGTDDYDPVRDEEYWLFPVEILAACRIRQQRGLDIPYVEHPLFDATPLGRYHSPLPIPRDEILEKVLPLYAKVTGELDLQV